MNSIFTRRSVRSFLPKEVEADKIEKLLQAAMQAPSAMNQQPWEFIVVRGAENLEKLSHFHVYATSMVGADFAIIVLCNNERLKSPLAWQQDLGAATQNLLLEATELGLGTVWFGTAPHQPRMDYVREFCDLPEHMVPYSVIAGGYPKDPDANHFKNRFDPTRVRYITE